MSARQIILIVLFFASQIFVITTYSSGEDADANHGTAQINITADETP